jgi:hypothetical protein
MNKDDENVSLVLHTANKITIKYPEPPECLEEKDVKTRQDKISKHGVYTNDGHCYLNKKAIPSVLCTDASGANTFYNDLENDDKLVNGNERFATVEAVNKELSKRIQEPRDAYVREKLKYGEKCLNEFRDSPEISELRSIGESKIRKELPNLKEKKIKAENLETCQLTNEPLEKDAAAHHIERKSDKPRKATDLENILVINPNPHEIIHKEGAESKEELNNLAEQLGWNVVP